MTSPDTLQRNPYLALGLKRNPFVLESDFLLPDSLWIDRGWSVAPKPGDRRLIQLMGARGVGKTSHLRYWQAQTGGPYCHYPPGLGRVKLPALSVKAMRSRAEILYWDEGDRIPYPFLISACMLAARRHQTIAVGTHKDLGSVARLAGLKVSTIYLKPFESRMLLDWTRRRIESARVGNQKCRLHLSNCEAEKITNIAKGSWRDAADELHIWAAQQANRYQSQPQ